MQVTCDTFILRQPWAFVVVVVREELEDMVMGSKRLMGRERGIYERTEGMKEVGEVFWAKKRGWEECQDVCD